MSMDTDMNPAISFSTSGSEIVTATHEFKITGYSLYKDFGVNKYVESKKFNAGGYEWTIRFYPDGQDPKDDSYVSLYVALASDETNATALFELNFLDQSGKNQHYVRKSKQQLFGRDLSWGYVKFYYRSLLGISSDYIKDDCLLIRCRLWVLSDIIPPSNIGQQIGQLLEGGEGCDVKFNVGGEIFAAHKLVLALRSPVFKAQLAGPMKGDDSKECIEITDMESAVFKTLLHFIYWDALPDELECVFVQHLLVAADRYGIERLLLICEAKLCEAVSIDTAATTLALAEQHHCLRLKSVCLEFFAHQKNLENVMQTEGFTHLQSSCPSVIHELIRCIARIGGHSTRSEANASQV